MAITDRNLAPGTKLVAKYKGQTYVAGIVEVGADDGQPEIRYRLEDGGEFKTPSGAGSAVRGGKATNGWAFWSLATDASPKDEPALKPKRAKKTKEEGPAEEPALEVE